MQQERHLRCGGAFPLLPVSSPVSLGNHTASVSGGERATDIALRLGRDLFDRSTHPSANGALVVKAVHRFSA
jgi:hypothetical protein